MSTENDVEEKLEEAFDKIQRMFSLQFTGNPDAKLDFSNIISGENKELKEGILEEKKYTILKVIITFAVASFSLICYQILSFFQKLGIEISYLFFAIPWMILLVVYVIIVMKINKKQEKVSNKNNENYNSKIVIKAIREVLPNASVNAESFIPASMLFATGAVPRFDIQEGEYFVSYNKNNKAYGFSNIRLEYVSSDGEDSRYRSETIFRGQIFQILQSFNIDGMVCIRTKTKKRYFHYRKKDRREKKVEVYNSEFNKYFEVFETSEGAALSVLSPYVIEQLLALRNQFGIFGMIVKQNGMQVAVNTNYTLFTRPFSFYDISQISTDNVKNELNSFITIIERFENAICYR